MSDLLMEGADDALLFRDAADILRDLFEQATGVQSCVAVGDRDVAVSRQPKGGDVRADTQNSQRGLVFLRHIDGHRGGSQCAFRAVRSQQNMPELSAAAGDMLPTHDEDGTRSMVQNAAGDATEQQFFSASKAPAAHHDQIRFFGFCYAQYAVYRAASALFHPQRDVPLLENGPHILFIGFLLFARETIDGVLIDCHFPHAQIFVVGMEHIERQNLRAEMRGDGSADARGVQRAD